MKTHLRYKVCDEEGTLRKFATKTEAMYFMRCRDDLTLLVEKRQKKSTEPIDNAFDFGEAVF